MSRPDYRFSRNFLMERIDEGNPPRVEIKPGLLVANQSEPLDVRETGHSVHKVDGDA